MALRNIYINFALILVFCNHGLHSQTIIDSLILKINSRNFSDSDIDKSINLKYDYVVNHLNASYKLYSSIYQSILFEKTSSEKKADLIEKLALVTYLKGDQEASSELHKKSIQLYKQTGNDKKMAEAMVSMAYQGKRRNIQSSFLIMREAIHILNQKNYEDALSSASDNLAIMFEINKDYDSASVYYQKALKLNIKRNDSTGMAYVLNNLAGLYFLQDNIQEGLKYINQSNVIRKTRNDFIGLAWNENNLGEMYINKGLYKDAEPHIRNSLAYSFKTNYPELISRNMQYLSQLLAYKKQFDSAYHYQNVSVSLRDSIYNSNKQKQILELETLYESERKSSHIKELNTQNLLNEKEIDKRKNQMYFLSAIILLSVGGIILILNAYRAKNKANLLITEQKKEVEKQKQLVLEKQQEILDSIQYARKIQAALLANQEFINQYLPNNFILYKPKDIVSGDFYWATKVISPAGEELFYLAVCDSTGHGVPGAFMSLLNIGFLNEAINEKSILTPNEIFNYVRSRLISSISKEGQKDGFDGILICLHNSSGKITYAAANNAPVLIRNNQLNSLPYSKMPVGESFSDKGFELFSIDFEKGDHLYIYTDGYADQFGGPRGKKFMYKQLNNFLSEISSKSVEIQKDLLISSFENWKGELEQVDDVAILGFRL